MFPEWASPLLGCSQRQRAYPLADFPFKGMVGVTIKVSQENQWLSSSGFGQ
jgi:hypothetical protein